MADVSRPSRPASLLRHRHRRETDGADDLLARHRTKKGDVYAFGDIKSAWFKDPDGNIIAIVNR
jgi:hypothetical protein